MYIPSQTSLPLSLKRSFIIVFSLSTLIGYGALVFAVAPPPGPGGYLPGTVLDPGCLPGESIAEGDAYDCFVQTSSGGSIVPTNGLSPIGGNSIGLGGELGEATTIDRNGHDFSITNGNMFIGGLTLPDIESLGMYYLDFNSHVAGFGVQDRGGNDQAVQILWQDFNNSGRNSQIYITENGIDLSKNASDEPGTHDGLRFMIGSLDGNLTPHFNLRGIDNDPQHVNTVWENTVDPTENNWTYDKLALIRNDGNWQWHKYPSSRDDSGTETPQNVLYTDIDGNILSSPISELAFSPSDETLKTITSYTIANHQASILDMVHDIKTIRYYWNDDVEQSKENIGFIAQNIQQVFPELVRTGTNGKLAVNYAGMTPVLVEAIQELNLKVDMLQLGSGYDSENIFVTLKDWLGNVGNGIEQFFSKKVITQEICIQDNSGETCIDRSQLNELLDKKSVEKKVEDKDQEESSDEIEEEIKTGETEEKEVEVSEEEKETEKTEEKQEGNTEQEGEVVAGSNNIPQ